MNEMQITVDARADRDGTTAIGFTVKTAHSTLRTGVYYVVASAAEWSALASACESDTPFVLHPENCCVKIVASVRKVTFTIETDEYGVFAHVFPAGGWYDEFLEAAAECKRNRLDWLHAEAARTCGTPGRDYGWRAQSCRRFAAHINDKSYIRGMMKTLRDAKLLEDFAELALRQECLGDAAKEIIQHYLDY